MKPIPVFPIVDEDELVTFHFGEDVDVFSISSKLEHTMVLPCLPVISSRSKNAESCIQDMIQMEVLGECTQIKCSTPLYPHSMMTVRGLAIAQKARMTSEFVNENEIYVLRAGRHNFDGAIDDLFKSCSAVMSGEYYYYRLLVNPGESELIKFELTKTPDLRIRKLFEPPPPLIREFLTKDHSHTDLFEIKPLLG